VRSRLITVWLLATVACEPIPIGGELNGAQSPSPAIDGGIDQTPIPAPADSGTPNVPLDAGQAPIDAGQVQVDASAPPPSGGWPQDQARAEEDLLALLNVQRARGTTCGGRQYGPADPVTMNPQLRGAARAHSQDMADNNYFSHTSQDGRSPWDRMDAAGYSGFSIGENIAAGNRSAADTFSQWLNSAGHCSNMMNPDAEEIGIGYAINPQSRFTHYWTQVFGSR